MLQANGLIRSHQMKGREVLETAHDQVRETVVRGLSPESAQGPPPPGSPTPSRPGGWPTPRRSLSTSTRRKSPKTAAEYVTRAARQASEALAFDRAARLYLVALNLSTAGKETRALRVSLGDALANAGRGAEAAEVFIAATRGASAAENLELRRRAAEQLLRSGHVDRGLAAIRDVLTGGRDDAAGRAATSVFSRSSFAGRGSASGASGSTSATRRRSPPST